MHDKAQNSMKAWCADQFAKVCCQIWVYACSDLVTTMCDDLYDNVQMLTNSVIVMGKVKLATLQSTIIKWQH